MSLPGMTATARVCRSCSKLFSFYGNKFRCSAFSTSTVRNDEDDINVLKSNPYFGKYSTKISKLQQTTPEEWTQRIAAFQTLRQSKADNVSSKQTSTFTKKKQLSDIVKLDLLRDKSMEEITEIWLKYHTTLKDAISVVLTTDVYNLMLQTSLKHPMFLLPLPRDHGYEYFVSQSCGDEFHLTPLINYQTFKENAPECLALTHFTDLSNNKGLILMQGEFNSDILNVSEAMCLTNQLHRYYGEEDLKRSQLLERFTNAPMEFRHMDLIVELERMAS